MKIYTELSNEKNTRTEFINITARSSYQLKKVVLGMRYKFYSCCTKIKLSFTTIFQVKRFIYSYHHSELYNFTVSY